jgi:phosphinothricin acetyltransferase
MDAPEGLVIRAAHRDDLPAIHAIYNEAIETTTATWDEAPWPWEQRLAWWAGHDALTPVLVAEHGGAVVGFAYLTFMSAKSGWRFTREDTIYLHREYRGRGVGRVLLGALIDAARAIGVHLLVASITSDNEASIVLHRRLGFEVVGELREAGWKFGQRHTTTYMQLIIE